MQINTTSRLQIQQEKEVICSSCRLKFQDVPSYKLHRLTEFHVYNTKRQIAELEPISEEVFEQKKALLANSNLSVSVTTSWKCQPCSKSFKTIEMLDEHKKSKKHKKSEKEYLAAHPEAQPSSIFKSIQHESSSNGDILSELHKSLQQSQQEPLSIEEDSAEPHVKTTLESLRICLFCNLESQGVKRSIDHMREEHNFYILDIECLINLKGLLAYIAERIQLGKMCLHCDKQFRSPKRCQQHMIDQGHCMMPLDADEEFEVFYDFRRAYTDINIKRREKINAITAEETLENAERTYDLQEERKIVNQQRMASNEGPKQGDHVDDQQSSDDWEDCDVEDDPAAGNKTDSFQVIDPSKTSSYQLIDSHSEINDAAESNSMSEFTQLSTVIGQKRKGKSRIEAFQELDIEPVELLPSGELRLPNGKIIGHRDYKHVYRQRLRLPDEREQVVINKLAVEYRKARHGGQLMLTDGQEQQKIAVQKYREQDKFNKEANYRQMHKEVRTHKLYRFFCDPTGHLQ